MISSTDNSQISLALGQKDVKFLNGITAEQILSQILESDPNSSQEIILIKDHITDEECDLVRRFHHCNVIAEETSASFVEFQIRKCLRDKLSLLPDGRIGLNYILFSNVLYAFPSPSGVSFFSDCIRISPVTASEIGIQLVPRTSEEKNVPSASDESEEPLQLSMFDSDSQTTPLNKNNEEWDILCKDVAKAFRERFAVIDAKFHNTAIEGRKFALTDFYRKFRIADGHLIGSWKIFESEDIHSYMDSGLLQKARDLCDREFTAMIPGRERIILRENICAYEKTLNKIMTEYIEYLSGKNTSSVGSVGVKTPCTILSHIDSSKKKLRDYLLDILNQSSKLSESSRDYVDSYIAKRFPSFESLHDNASVTATTMTYDDDQWKKPDFFETVASTILDEGKNHFGVDSHLKELLEIGLDLLHSMK